MRSTSLVLAALLVVLGSGAVASAEMHLFEATFSLKGFGSPAPVGTAVGVAEVNGSGGGLHVTSLDVPGGLVTIQSTSTITTSTLLTKVIISITPGAGAFAGGSGSNVLAGPLPVPGNVRVCLLLNCLLFVDVPFTQNGTRGVGLGGTVTAPMPGTGTVSVVGATWAAATATINGTTGPVTSPGFAHGPLSATSSTVQTDGVLQLVTPVQVRFDAGAPPVVLPVFGTLQVRFLPEPGAFAALAAGALGLVGLGRRQSSRASDRRSGGT
ncbi:MAG: hypothetical protein ACQGVC_21915 [Myxococcota bacterium]